MTARMPANVTTRGVVAATVLLMLGLFNIFFLFSIGGEESQTRRDAPTAVGSFETKVIEDPSLPKVGSLETTVKKVDPSLPKVGLCVTTKDRELYLDEWVDYNLAIGFHAIYVFDNSDNFELQDWGKARSSAHNNSIITVIHNPEWRGKGLTRTQQKAYKNCAKWFGKQSPYLAFFDDDEFLVLKKHETVGELVRDHLAEDGGSLSIHWRIFGASNHTIHSPLPVTKRFQRRGQTHHNIKSIVRSQDYGDAINAHAFILLHNTTQKDTSGGTEFSKSRASSSRKYDDVAVIHHYKYKSAKEYRFKNCMRLDRNSSNCDVPLAEFTDEGTSELFDDAAWQILKSRVPKYAVFDQWTDYM
jgi:hypothetical protein